MAFFSKSETTLVLIVLLVIGTLSYFNLRIAIRRSRDFQRKDDVSNIANALFDYHEDFGVYPENSPDGKIVACLGEEVDLDITAGELANHYRPCDWWYDGLSNPLEQTAYLERIPGDPKTGEGYSYRYISTPDHFQLLASLEGADEDEYSEFVESRNLICGVATCNFGKGSPDTPLDKSLEEYENELER